MDRQTLLNKLASDKEIVELCLNISKDRSAHKDLYQDLMLKICQDENILAKAEKNYLKWHIVVTARNLWIDRCRKQQLTQKIFTEYEPYGNEIIDDSSIEAKVIAELKYQNIDNKFLSLSDNEQKLFLAYVEAGSICKLSKQMQIPRKTLNYHINNIIARLK